MKAGSATKRSDRIIEPPVLRFKPVAPAIVVGYSVLDSLPLIEP